MAPAERIHVWFGTGDGECLGPLQGRLVASQPDGEHRILIDDQSWLDHLSWRGPWAYTCQRLRTGEVPGYDDYGFTFPGDPEPPGATPW